MVDSSILSAIGNWHDLSAFGTIDQVSPVSLGRSLYWVLIWNQMNWGVWRGLHLFHTFYYWIIEISSTIPSIGLHWGPLASAATAWLQKILGGMMGLGTWLIPNFTVIYWTTLLWTINTANMFCVCEDCIYCTLWDCFVFMEKLKISAVTCVIWSVVSVIVINSRELSTESFFKL